MSWFRCFCCRATCWDNTLASALLAARRQEGWAKTCCEHEGCAKTCYEGWGWALEVKNSLLARGQRSHLLFHTAVHTALRRSRLPQPLSTTHLPPPCLPCLAAPTATACRLGRRSGSSLAPAFSTLCGRQSSKTGIATRRTASLASPAAGRSHPLLGRRCRSTSPADCRRLLSSEAMWLVCASPRSHRTRLSLSCPPLLHPALPLALPCQHFAHLPAAWRLCNFLPHPPMPALLATTCRTLCPPTEHCLPAPPPAGAYPFFCVPLLCSLLPLPCILLRSVVSRS